MDPIYLAFPLLTATPHRFVTPADGRYNCTAWAAGETHRNWWPVNFPGAPSYYWPPGVPRLLTIDAFVQAYATLGYVRCDSSLPESGYEKIALYAQGELPTHAARLRPNGNWSSKLGKDRDIEHVLGGLTSQQYGRPVCYLRRPIPEKKGTKEKKGKKRR